MQKSLMLPLSGAFVLVAAATVGILYVQNKDTNTNTSVALSTATPVPSPSATADDTQLAPVSTAFPTTAATVSKDVDSGLQSIDKTASSIDSSDITAASISDSSLGL